MSEEMKQYEPKSTESKEPEKVQSTHVETTQKVDEPQIPKDIKIIEAEEVSIINNSSDNIFQEKFSEDKLVEQSPAAFMEENMEENFDDKQSVGLKGDSDEGLEGDILDDEMKNVAESIIGEIKPVTDKNVGHIGAKTNELPKYIEPQPQNLDQSLENSEVTSEDDTKNVYNYFGNYRPVFNPIESNFPQNDTMQSSSFNQYGSILPNNNIQAGSFGLGLFQTKRRTSRYDKYNYFPTSSSVPKERITESPKKVPNVNRTPFFTGSEDESGVISESSVSSKPFYGQHDLSADEDRDQRKNLQCSK